MVNRRSLMVAAVLAVATLVAGSSAALGISRINNLTFNRAVALPGVVLPAGGYTFEVIGDSIAGFSVVRVWARTGNRIYYTGITHPVERPRDMDPNRAVELGEGVRGEAPPIKAWYPLGSEIGHAFVYRR